MKLISFDPEVWGTVSDWFMVAVTTITAYYLYKTLKSQKEVQTIQNKLFEMESLRFREGIKPILKYSKPVGKTLPNENHKTLYTIEIINETSQDALDISFSYTDSEVVTRIEMYIGVKKTFLKLGDKPMLIHFLLEDDSVTIPNYIFFETKYRDISGTKYTQKVICDLNPYFGEVNPMLPEAIN